MAEQQSNGRDASSPRAKSLTVTYDPDSGEFNVAGCVHEYPAAIGMLESAVLLVREQWAMRRLAERQAQRPVILPVRPRA